MKNILLASLVWIMIATCIVTPLFVQQWYYHTAHVQRWVQTSIDTFKEHDIDWSEFHVSDKEESLDQIHKLLISSIRVLIIGPIKQAKANYKDHMYEIIRMIVNDDLDDLDTVLQSAKEAQIELYRVSDKFQSSRLYAMKYTF